MCIFLGVVVVVVVILVDVGVCLRSRMVRVRVISGFFLVSIGSLVVCQCSFFFLCSRVCFICWFNERCV